MGAQTSSVEGVHVVVVGGGFGGVAAAQQLKSKGLSFTLIDMRDAFHHNVGGLRASVQPGFALRTFIPYAETFGESFVQGRVERVDPQRQVVVLQGGREVTYSHLILCTGTDGPFPGKFNTVASYESAIQAYEDLVKQIQNADSVLVVGGGSTGVEMAAELKTEYPQKKVVLVHARSVLADVELLNSVRRQAKDVLLEKGVELQLGQKVSDLSGLTCNVTRKNMEVTLANGTTLTTDLIINCSGLRVNSAAYQSSFSGSLAQNGTLRVNEHLQVEAFSHVYAVGDCADVREPKTAYVAGLHAAVAVGNIVNSLSGNSLTSHRAGNVTMLLAMGRDDGVGQFNGFRLPRFLVAVAKSRDLLVWKSWKDMRQQQP
ncbi:apoptosis-inducing factor 2 [Entelurus aequoreus]|uniref:apoptosis-inducing factor 2 n=1 Tax=Entelurus aequoreus TaxID=161455 RepID=UPI002B1D9C12|nr:apoptosis-inducing factor 2 [Entelurus aequoreus]XP_061915370.1 apoptosis-inducing factor 2 [Entelurus aequoreus]XP_061915371.1 apoptosis-inducing factor 2 [Entelurus aequoreus]XP_061915372.1 apoptosis-inducing factor 2 [Entelurus aequoreus]